MNFKDLPPIQVLQIWRSFEHEHNNQKIQLKVFEYFEGNFEQVQKYFDKDPKLPLNILCAYTFFHQQYRFRKELKREDEVPYEKFRLQELYGPSVITYFKSYDKLDIFRLSYVLEVMNFVNYEEIYSLVEGFLNNNLSKIEPYFLSIILKNGQRANLNRGIFSRKFFTNLLENLH